MAFLWFSDVTPHERKRVQLYVQQKLVQTRRGSVRATLEIAPNKRPWNKAQSVFLCAMRETAGLRETCDIKWVSTGIRVLVNSAPSGALPVFHSLLLSQWKQLGS